MSMEERAADCPAPDPEETPAIPSDPWPFLALAAAAAGYLAAGLWQLSLHAKGGTADMATAILPHQVLMLAGVMAVAASRTGAFADRLRLHLRRPLDLALAAGATLFLFPALLIVAQVAALILGLLHRPVEESPIMPLIRNAPPGDLVLLTVAAVTLAPLAEELVFRRVLFTCLQRFVGMPLAIVATAAIFATFHVSLAQWAPLFILGLALQAAVLLSDSLWTAIVMHAVHNALAITILLVHQAWTA